MGAQSNIDETDTKILKILLKDARTNIKEIAKECNLTSSSVLNRIKNLKKTGVILGTELRLKQGTFGYLHKASIGITADTSKLDEVAKSIRDQPNVIVCAKSIGKYNMFCLLSAKNMSQLNNATRTIKNIDGVKGIAINIWIDQYECIENQLNF